ncbi:prolipoprotein diacylglyceryl transferase [Cognatiyoonia sp.]|uniref:prolipoprotein diacylglyceryl transferase n=1 Tax=Cognatiyoonia sp. TaxID=2211652 RepID=UPI003F697EE9
MLAALSFPNISPEIFAIEVFGFNLALRWYALTYIAGIALGWMVIAAMIRRPHLWPNDTPPLKHRHLEDLLTYIVVGVIVGGRLGFVTFYKPAYYLQNPLEIPMIWTGGMSFHGGFIGVVLAVILFSRKHKIPLPHLSDVIALAATPAIFLVRCANFINGELWGRPTDAPWGVIFPSEAAQDCPTVAEILCARHPSQLYEATLEGLILGLLLHYLCIRRGAFKLPWLTTGMFLAGYGASRFLVEFFRQPDAQFRGPENPLGWALDFGNWGVTMGQLLSTPMIALGLIVIMLAKRNAL